MDPPQVFVYGTLMPGQRNYQLAARFSPQVQKARLRSFALYHLEPEGYPAIIPSRPELLVHGQLLRYQLDTWPYVLPLLDELEGVREIPPLYQRELVTVQVEYALEPTWTYIYARPARLGWPGAQVLREGDWTKRPNIGL